MGKKEQPNFDFEGALKELNHIVEEMEHGGLTLEQSLEKFERGISLTKQCQTSLKDAEQKIQILMEQNGKEELKPFEGLDEG